MAKPRTTLTITLPAYQANRRTWKWKIDHLMQKVREERGVQYPKGRPLSVAIRLYLSDRHLDFLDVDNAAKLILDALHGRFGGSKRINYAKRIIPNDNQVRRLTVEKLRVPGQAKKSGGRLVIRKHTKST